MILDFFRNTAVAVRDINQKYAKPHIEITRVVRFSLSALRFYLLLLVGIMIYKFITLLH